MYVYIYIYNYIYIYTYIHIICACVARAARGLMWLHEIDGIPCGNLQSAVLFRRLLFFAAPAFTLWLFNIAMENGPFIDDFPS